MACLHLISGERALTECLTVAAEIDAILLLGRAAELAIGDVGRPLLVLEDDLAAEASCPDGMTPIDYAEFVALAADHQPIITWR